MPPDSRPTDVADTRYHGRHVAIGVLNASRVTLTPQESDVRIFYGPIIGSDEWVVQVGERKIVCKNSATAYVEARRLAPRADRLCRVGAVPDPREPPAPVVPKAKPAPKAATPPKVDTSILDGNAKSAVRAIESGDHDAALSALHSAESEGKERTTVLRAIASRRG